MMITKALSKMERACAEGGNRTLIPFREHDFESCASANSATPACGANYNRNSRESLEEFFTCAIIRSIIQKTILPLYTVGAKHLPPDSWKNKTFIRQMLRPYHQNENR